MAWCRQAVSYYRNQFDKVLWRFMASLDHELILTPNPKAALT